MKQASKNKHQKTNSKFQTNHNEPNLKQNKRNKPAEGRLGLIFAMEFVCNLMLGAWNLFSPLRVSSEILDKRDE
ncbi:MAG: hypothetical protein O7G31_11840 [Calditrichaeota bacterium]|nr:hypothetical protein [Calditrichota bacterium]